MRDVTEWGTPFDSYSGVHNRADFDWMLGIKVSNARRILAARNGFVLRVIGKGPKRYPITMDIDSKRLNVAVSKWNRRIIYVDGLY